MIRLRWVCILVLFSVSLLTAQQTKENSVIMGSGFEKDQHSAHELAFTAPTGWKADEAAEKKLGLYRILVPNGQTVEHANRVITIAFQKKDVHQPGLDTLENFVRVDMNETLESFPDAQFERWQPSRLDPDKIRFWSIEMFGKKKDKPSPQRFLILDAGDGFYSVTLTTASRADLKWTEFDKFFNSLSLSSHD